MCAKASLKWVAGIESLTTIEDIFDKLDSRENGDSGKWGPLTDMGE